MTDGHDITGNLSANFNLREFTESETASKEGYAEQFAPPDEVVENLENLCVNVLQKVRDIVGPLTVTSGYRCERLNNAVGGKPTSQHLKGYAADIQFHQNGVMENRLIVDTVLENHIIYDQMIWESGGKWIHISFKEGKNRMQYFSA
jgi:hypothetical protein